MTEAFDKKELILGESSSLPVKLSSVEVLNASNFSKNYISTLLQPLLQRNLYDVSSLAHAIESVQKRFVLANNESLSSAKAKIQADEDGTNKVVISLPTEGQKADKFKLITHTNEFGTAISASGIRVNPYGNGEVLVIEAGIDSNLSTNFVDFNCVRPSTSFNFGFNVLQSSIANSDTIRSIFPAITRSTIVGPYLLTGLLGTSISQVISKSGVQGKSSLSLNLGVGNIETISSAAFPISGMKHSVVAEYGLSSKLYKLFHEAHHLLPIANNAVTFSHSSITGLLVGDNIDHYKFSYGLMAPQLTGLKPLMLDPIASQKIQGNYVSSHTFRVLTKVPIFSKAVLDESSVLRMHFTMNTFTQSDSFATFKSAFQTKALNAYNQNGITGLATSIPASVGCGLIFRSPIASAEIGYNTLVSDDLKGVHHQGLKFDISVSLQ